MIKIKKNIVSIKIRNKNNIKFYFILCVLILLLYQVSNGNKRTEKIDETSSVFVDEKESFKLFSSETQSSLNTSISLNQTGYLPGSVVNITLTLKNNFSQSLTNIQFDSAFNSDIELLSGNLQSNFTSLSVGETVSSSILFQIPDNETENIAPSLDVVFLIDGSGSMGQEIDEVKAKVLDLVDELKTLVDDLRVGFIFFGSTIYSENPYDDQRNILDFTNSQATIQEFVNLFSAGGVEEPWGDALNYMKGMSWQENSIRVAILITDEMDNNGRFIRYDSHRSTLATELAELEIIVSTMECYGSDDGLTEQLTSFSEVTGGIYTQLSSDASTLIDEAIIICEEAIGEYGLKIETNFTADLGGSALTKLEYKWILIDNNPPSLSISYMPVFQPNEDIFLYRMICRAYDSSPVENVTLYYQINVGIFLKQIMETSTSGIFTFLFPYLNEGDRITYYLEAWDILNNTITTEQENFTVNFDITELFVDSFLDLALDAGESVLLKINLTTIDDYAFLTYSEGKSSIDFVCQENTSLSEQLTFTDQYQFNMKRLSNFSGSAILSLISDEISGLISIQLVLTKISQSTIDSETNVIISSQNPVYLYELDINSDDNTFHCIVDIEDEFQFFKLSVFNVTTLLKTHYFHTISVDAESPGRYYILILLTDTRPDPITATVKINSGEINDDPYWQTYGASSPSINGFPIFSILLLIFGPCIAICVIKKRKIKIR
ncbi:hypothetical protein LCGC14_0766620 [marine sediment metagenome]|uniref:VWFA domain-containing protein n=1 Tax=marine sediment metagenome TaxID=412755 RepID=A0A0F9Q3T1_9ZZZZ|nr:VWA domain-containing protein [bacterium]